MYAFLVVAASWKGLVEDSLIPHAPLMVPRVISILPFQTCTRPKTVLPGLCIDSPALQRRRCFLKISWWINPRNGWKSAASRTTNPMMTCGFDQVGLYFADSLASQMANPTAMM